MLLFFRLSMLYLYPENEAEASLLIQPATASRLAFIPARDLPQDADVWRLYSASSPFMDWKKRYGTLPVPISESGSYLYWLRVFADHIAIKQGLLPLHCAVIKYKQIAIFIFAPSGGGKSALASFLANGYSSCSLICDDHGIIDGNFIFGNSLIRLRTSQGDDFRKTSAHAKYSPEMSYGLSSGFGDNSFQPERNDDFSTPSFYYEALKYIEEEPRSYPATLKDIFGDSIRTLAEEHMRTFLYPLKACYRGRGSLAFLSKNILDLCCADRNDKRI